ncbi:MAG: response regulator [Elusimicrobiota bacterium]|jgi:two-component system chemotaxis response regulator CheY
MGHRILVVDDSPLSRILLKEMLTSLGHQVVGEAQSGEECLASYKELQPELVTLDISLPDMDGLTVLRELRAISPQARAVLVSGNDQKRVLEQAKLLKAPLVCKPFSPADLEKAVVQACS